MEKLTKSLSLFKERNCFVSIVLDSRTRRKNACEFPLSLRLIWDMENSIGDLPVTCQKNKKQSSEKQTNFTAISSNAFS